jgi:hypothetical protein
MASTRNKNTPGDYKLEQLQHEKNMNYNTYQSYGVPIMTTYAGDGLLMGRMAPENLTNNACDIESQLRGIGSTNLVNPQSEVQPQMKDIQSLNICEKIPMILPTEFNHLENQRPFRGM